MRRARCLRDRIVIRAQETSIRAFLSILCRSAGSLHLQDRVRLRRADHPGRQDGVRLRRADHAERQDGVRLRRADHPERQDEGRLHGGRRSPITSLTTRAIILNYSCRL